jgi:pyrroline-5-carboxylate reductase
MSKRIGFIGGGRIVRIMLEAWRQDGLDLADISFSESSDEAAALLAADFPEARRRSQAEVAAEADLIFVALPPGAIIAAIEGGKLRPRAAAILVSLAPKVSLAALSAALGGFARVARLLPNAPSIVGSGYNPVAFGAALGKGDRAALLELLAPLGESPEVEEAKIEAYAVISAMGPTYFFFQFFELLELARGFGLSEGEARTAILAMVSGSADAALGSGLEPERVLDLVSSRPMAPNEEAIEAMYESALKGAYAKLKG